MIGKDALARAYMRGLGDAEPAEPARVHKAVSAAARAGNPMHYAWVAGRNRALDVERRAGAALRARARLAAEAVRASRREAEERVVASEWPAVRAAALADIAQHAPRTRTAQAWMEAFELTVLLRVRDADADAAMPGATRDQRHQWVKRARAWIARQRMTPAMRRRVLRGVHRS